MAGPRFVRFCAAVFLAVCVDASPAPADSEAPTPADLAAGLRMYREGIAPTGQPVRAMVVGDVSISSANVTCVSCHRRSGFGSVEGDKVAPPVVRSVLYRTGDPRSESFKRNLEMIDPNADDPGLRPAYDDQSLARAIREGIGAGGHMLDPLMPRYDFTDAQVGQLVAYLKSLSGDPSPGVSDTEIHFATVFAGNVGAERRDAELDVFNAYFADMNGLTRNEKEHTKRGLWYREWRDKSYRQLRLHVWNIDGPPESWGEQLHAYYREQPVFAMIGGIGDGDWQPIHAFCEANEIPCLLPNTDLPVIADGDFYNVYFSKGLTLEAQALARYLGDSGGLAAGRTILQVFRSGPRGATPAAAFREAVAEGGFQGLVEQRVDGPEAPTAAFWNDLIDRHRPDALIVWMDAADLAFLGAPLSSRVGGLYASTTLLHDPLIALPRTIWDRTYMTHRYFPPENLKRMRRLYSWLGVKKIEARDPILQASAYAAARIAGNSLRRMRGFFSREHFIEQIEHLVDSAPMDSPYPRLALGPGQRFLSRHVYILQPSPARGGSLAPVADLLVN